MRLVVFDLDGTLVDSAALVVESATAAFEAAGEVPPDDVAIRSISGLTLNIAIQRLVPHADRAAVSRLEEAYRREYLARATAQMREPLFPGALEALRRLKARDDCLLAVATGKALRGAKRVLSTHGIDALFTCVQTPDHNPSKPHPGMIHSAIAATGADKSRTIMIGDTNHDMEMATAAQVGALGVSWGYHLSDALVAAGAHHIIDHFDDLDDAIEHILERTDA